MKTVYTVTYILTMFRGEIKGRVSQIKLCVQRSLLKGIVS